MTTSNTTLGVWRRLSNRPAGKWLFSRLVCWRAPYFASIRPRFAALEPGRSVVHMKKRRRVQNHIGTVHAIAICNLAEIAAGTMTDATVPPSHRWIPKGMSVEYLAKAETNLTGVARIDPIPAFADAEELPVDVLVTDAQDRPVFRATITMWVTPKS